MIDKNDPRLTQYVLGELDDRDALAIENAIADSPELQSVVEEIREVTVALENEFQSELLPSLLREQVSEVVSVAGGENGDSVRRRGVSSKEVDIKVSVPRRPTIRIYWGAAIAVSIVILSGALLLKAVRFQTQRQVTNLEDLESDVKSDSKSDLDEDVSLESLVSEFNTFLEARRLDEATAVANKAAEKFPDSDVTQALVWKSKFATRMSIQNQSQSKETGVQDAMASTLSSSAPMLNDGEPLEFGDAAAWRELVQQRGLAADEYDAAQNDHAPPFSNPTDEFGAQLLLAREKYLEADLLTLPSAGMGGA